MNRSRYVLFPLAALVVLAASSPSARGPDRNDPRHGHRLANQGPLQGALVTVVGTAKRAETNSNGEYVLDRGLAGLGPRAGPDDRVRPGPAHGDARGRRRSHRRLRAGPGRGPAGGDRRGRLRHPGSGRARSAVSSVKAEELVGQPIASIDGALQGKAPGVQVVQNAGNPGNASRVRVRGAASVSASNDPLYVIDGVPMVSGDISQLDAGGQSIAALTTLSTRRGREHRHPEGCRRRRDLRLPRLQRGGDDHHQARHERPDQHHLQLFVGTQSAARRIELLNGTEYLEFFNESATNDGEDADFYGVLGVDDTVNVDWQDAVLRTAPMSSSELAVSGGNDRLAYRVSGNWFDQHGIVRASGYRRLGGRINLDFNPTGRPVAPDRPLVLGGPEQPSGERRQRRRASSPTPSARVPLVPGGVAHGSVLHPG